MKDKNGLFALPTLIVGVVMSICGAVMFHSCQIEPPLHLVDPGDAPMVELDVEVNYEIGFDIDIDWHTEWYYYQKWDDVDQSIFGHVGYEEPTSFHLRRYYTGNEPFGKHTNVDPDEIDGYIYEGPFTWGFWDLLVWNKVKPFDGVVQNLNFDESASLDYVTAYTNQSMNAAHYNAPRYTRSFYQPEELFAAYNDGLEISRNMDGFTYDPERNVWVKKLNMLLTPLTYIYLTQIILHNNKGKIQGVEGSSNLSGMSRSVRLNDGATENDPVTVGFDIHMKPHCVVKDKDVDIIGGRLLTFGMCGMKGLNARTRSGKDYYFNDGMRHYMDVNMQFINGKDSTFVFDVTEQVRRQSRGGILTIELDCDTVHMPIGRPGSGFDATVEDMQDGGTWEIPM